MSRHHAETNSSDLHRESIHSSDRPAVFSIFAFTNKSHLTVLIRALLLTTVAGAMKPILTIFLGHVFDNLTNFGSRSIRGDELLKNVSIWCTALTGLGIGTILVNGGFFGLWLIFGEMQARSARDKLFLSLLEKEIKWYDLQADGIGSLLSRVQTQIRELQLATSQPLGFFLEDTVVALTALGIAFYYSWNLTLVILAFVPLTVVVLAISTRKLQAAIEAQKRDLSEASKYSHTAIREVDTVKAFNGQEREVQQYMSAIRRAAKSYMIQANANSLRMGITRFMTTIVFFVGFWYGFMLVKQGLSPGSVLTTFYSCLMATQALEALLPQWLVLSKGISAGQALKQILLDTDSDRRLFKAMGALRPITCHGEVEVSKLTFSYPSNPNQYVFENASFFFPAGETTFVIGRSGSGKSTLGNLLMKFYTTFSGDILIDGKAIDLLDIEWLRSKVCFVQQDNDLFNVSLFRNIAFGRRPYSWVTEHEVRMASKMTMLQETINDMPEGLQTIIGRNGYSLSGGQKQRVAIARARLHDAPILILDEATSALDPITRSLVMDAIRKWRQGKTTIIITHDISDIKEKDYVYLLDKGNVVQEGYRQQLFEDKSPIFTSFASVLSENDKISFSNEPSMATSTRSTSLSERRKSYGDPHQAFDVRDNLPPTKDHRSRLRHVPKFFGLDETSRSRQDSNHRRMSRGIGMGSIYVTTLNNENTCSPGNILSFSKSCNAIITKPPPTLPLQREVQKIHLSNQDSSKNGFAELEMLDVRGKSTKKARLKTAGERRNRSITNDEEYESGHRTYLTGKMVSELSNPEESNNSNDRRRDFTLAHIFGTVWPNLMVGDRFTFVLGFVNAFISASATPAFSYVFARLLGTLSQASEQGVSIKTWSLAILAIATADGISNYYMHYLLEYSGQTWVDSLRVEALRRILAQPKVWFNKPLNNPGRLNEYLDRNAEEIRNIVGRFAGYVFLVCCMMIIAIVWAFILCWKLTLIILASGPCMYAFTRVFEFVNGKWEKRLNEMSDITGDVCSETFSNIKCVRALNLENHFKQKHARAMSNAFSVGMRRAAYTSLLFGMSDSTNTFVIALILYYGTAIVAFGDWSVESVLQVITLLIFSSSNANSVIAFIPQIGSSRTTGTQILRLANMPKIASHESQGTTYLLNPLPIRLNSLSFAYPTQPNLKVLHEISMTFPCGSCTAIVGSSGSGKSTIASILLGLQPPTEPLHALQPSLTFAGTSIFSCNMNNLRSQIALVAQHPVLFPCSIISNITYGLPAHSPFLNPRAIESATKAAGIHDFIVGLPEGYNTTIGEGGRGLSGGQAQRLCIARALVRQPKILILDEPTSALDGESASIIKDTIVRLTRNEQFTKDQASRNTVDRDGIDYDGMAVILITHNINMMRVASWIYVLERGHVVQEGNFEELAQWRGPFSKLISGVK